MDFQALALQKIALRCRTDLYFLCREVLNYDLMVPHVHQELCDYTTSILPGHPGVENIEGFDPSKNFLLLLMPRGTFKSTIVTIGLTLQYVLNEPNARILIDSETFSKSKAFLREIIDHFLSNPKYREIFKAIHGMYPFEKKSKAKLWTDSELILPCRTRPLKEPTISCAGIDVTKTGMHYDLIIMDDLHSEKNVTNIEQIKQVIDHYKLGLALLDPGKPLIVVGTRWSFKDLYQHLIDFESDRFNIYVKKAYNSDGSLLFPERLDKIYLDEQHKSLGGYLFSCQYLNDPVSDETAVFKREHIRYKTLEEIKKRPINWYLSVDPSYEGTYSDYAALVLAGMDFQRDIYVRYITRKKMTYGDIINEIFRIYTDKQFQDIKIQRIYLETIATQKSIGVELANEQRRRNTWLPVEEIRSQSTSKEERIRLLAPFYEFGHIFHIKESPSLADLEQELLHFPVGEKDDIVDALATIVERASPPNAKHFKQDDDEPKKRIMSIKPRSAVTGY